MPNMPDHLTLMARFAEAAAHASWSVLDIVGATDEQRDRLYKHCTQTGDPALSALIGAHEDGWRERESAAAPLQTDPSSLLYVEHAAADCAAMSVQIAELRAALARVEGERDEARAEAKRERERRGACEAWYAVRIEHIRVAAEEHGVWPLVAAVTANESKGPHDPPKFSQLLVWATHRADTAERVLEAIRTRTRDACKGTGLSPANAETVPEIVRALVDRLDTARAESARLAAELVEVRAALDPALAGGAS